MMARPSKTRAWDYVWETTRDLHKAGCQGYRPPEALALAVAIEDFRKKFDKRLPVDAICALGDLLDDAARAERVRP